MLTRCCQHNNAAMTTTALRVCQNMRKTVAPQERKACCNHYCRITSIARPIGAFHTSIARPIGTVLISISRSIEAIHTSITRPIRAIQPDSWWNFSLAFSCCCPLLVGRSPSISDTCNADRSRHRFICCASSTQLNSMCLHSVPMQD